MASLKYALVHYIVNLYGLHRKCTVQVGNLETGHGAWRLDVGTGQARQGYVRYDHMKL